MDFYVLPGPSLPELARTALARAAAATVSDADPRTPGTPAGRPVAPGQVPVRATWDGRPVLLPASGSWLEQRLSARRAKPAPDPLWRVAPAILRHLEHGHMGELVHCVRAHGMPQADWVIPRGLDRYGLQLLVLTTDGTALTCRCQAGAEAEHQHLHGPVSEQDH
jgi:hypothetical protein